MVVALPWSLQSPASSLDHGHEGKQAAAVLVNPSDGPWPGALRMWGLLLAPQPLPRRAGGGCEGLLVGVLCMIPGQGCLVALIPSPTGVRVRPGGSCGI